MKTYSKLVLLIFLFILLVSLVSRLKEPSSLQPHIEVKEVIPQEPLLDKGNVALSQPALARLISYNTLKVSGNPRGLINSDAGRVRYQQLVQLARQPNAITGVAFLDGRVYATTFSSNSILVFDITAVDAQPEAIIIKDLDFPSDITVDRDRKLLYVADLSMRIFVVQLASSTSAGNTFQFHVGFSANSLWFCHQSKQLVVTASGMHKLFVYRIAHGDSLPKPTVIQLRMDVHVKYAVQTTSGDYLIAQVRSLKNHRVAKVNSNGNIVRSYSGKQTSKDRKLNPPNSLALRADGSVLVADSVNGRVMQLDEQLEFVGIVVEGIPVSRLYIAEQEGLLIAGLNNYIVVYIM